MNMDTVFLKAARGSFDDYKILCRQEIITRGKHRYLYRLLEHDPWNAFRLILQEEGHSVTLLDDAPGGLLKQKHLPRTLAPFAALLSGVLAKDFCPGVSFEYEPQLHRHIADILSDVASLGESASLMVFGGSVPLARMLAKQIQNTLEHVAACDRHDLLDFSLDLTRGFFPALVSGILEQEAERERS